MNDPRPSIRQALTHSAGQCRDAGLEDSGLLAEMLIEDATGIPRLELAFHLDDPVPNATADRIRTWTGRVASGEPIQYVVGWCSFRGHRIRTDPRALIPRPETEELVSHVLADPVLRHAPVRAVDVGTGTGCIAIALGLEHPGVRVLAIDREEAALSLARENVSARGLDARITLRQGDGLRGIPEASADVVVSNPPYVAGCELAALPANVREHEPVTALVSGDGLELIRRLVPDAARCLRPGGSLWMEMGETQGEAVRGLLEGAGFEPVRILPDLSGRDRFAHGRKP